MLSLNLGTQGQKSAPTGSLLILLQAVVVVVRGEHQQARNIAAENKLRIAAAQGEVAQVKSILTTQDININAVDDQGRSALHQAVMEGHKEVAGRLIRHGADVALKDYQENKTPLDYAPKSDSKYFSAIAELVKLFSTLDNLIEDGIIKNQDDIDQKFDQVYSGLRKLEIKGPQVTDKEQYRYFKYRYHSHQAKYLSALGDEAEASYQEELAEEFQDLPFQSLDADEQQELEAQIASGTEETCVRDDAVAHMQNLLEDISAQGILDVCVSTILQRSISSLQYISFLRIMDQEHPFDRPGRGQKRGHQGLGSVYSCYAAWTLIAQAIGERTGAARLSVYESDLSSPASRIRARPSCPTR